MKSYVVASQLLALSASVYAQTSSSMDMSSSSIIAPSSLSSLISASDVSSASAAASSDASSAVVSSLVSGALSAPSVAPASSAVVSSSLAVASSGSVSSASFSIINPPSSSPATVVSSVASSVSASGTATGTSSIASASASAVAGLGPVCPGDNGKIFTANNVQFTITCGAGTVGKLRRSIESGVQRRQVPGTNAFGICITSCANTPTCQSLLFNPATGACALYDCVVQVPAGLSGAVRVGASTACPPTTPTNIPLNSAGQPNMNTNLNLNISVNVNVNVNVNFTAGVFNGLPYTQVCCINTCPPPCASCQPVPAPQCSICQKPGSPPPMQPSNTWYPPNVPGQPGYPGACTTCNYTPSYPSTPACNGTNCKTGGNPPSTCSGPNCPSTGSTTPCSGPNCPSTGSTTPCSGPNCPSTGSTTPCSGPNCSKTGGSTPSTCSGTGCSNTGKYSGPYSNDAAGVSAAGSLVGAAVALMAIVLA